MIYHLLRHFSGFFSDTLHFYAYQHVLFRAVLAILTSLVIALLIGPRIIRWLMRKKIGDRPEFHHAALNQLTKEKANTPTMGGLIILSSAIVTTLLWAKLNNPFVQKAIFVLLWFGILGGIDDWLKLTAASRQRGRNGLFAWEKLIFQIAGAVLIASFLFFDFAEIDDGKLFWLPFYKNGLALANWTFILIAIFYISATSNAVNLADGMDGLAGGCVAMVSLVLVILCYVASEMMSRTTPVTWASYLLLPHIPQAGELSIFFAAILGAVLGFLWFNCYPAQTSRRRHGLRRPRDAQRDPPADHRRRLRHRADERRAPGRLLQVHARQAPLPLRPAAPPFPPCRLERAPGRRPLLAPRRRLRRPRLSHHQAPLTRRQLAREGRKDGTME